MNSGKLVSKVILGEHDLSNLSEILRLIFLNPEDLGSGEAGECDITGEFCEFSLSDLVIKIIGFSSGTSVIPENSGTDDVVILIKDNKAVHLSAERDSGNL